MQIVSFKSEWFQFVVIYAPVNRHSRSSKTVWVGVVVSLPKCLASRIFIIPVNCPTLGDP